MKPDLDTIELTVRNREAILYQGAVELISSVNAKGKFDILPLHANFISLVGEVLTIREKGGNVKEIPVDNGIVKARENKVEIYLGIKK